MIKFNVDDHVRIAQTDDELYKGYIGLTGVITEIREDNGTADLPITIRFDVSSEYYPDEDAFYPEELEMN